MYPAGCARAEVGKLFDLCATMGSKIWQGPRPTADSWSAGVNQDKWHLGHTQVLLVFTTVCG